MQQNQPRCRKSLCDYNYKIGPEAFYRAWSGKVKTTDYGMLMWLFTIVFNTVK